jgi:pantoate--beta-alanine ligase
MIVRLDDPASAAEWCAAERAGGRTLGFVPTMGALHAGHISLVRRALEENDAACVSVFVNPLQFDEAQDFDHYPRDFEEDARLLDEAGCSMVFTGTLAQFFPDELDAEGRLKPEHWVQPGAAAAGLEGACRNGHFEGVATIVDRLFEVVGPTRAYFGQKDYQQALVVGDLARRRGNPEVRVCPIAREAHGLARSSRNERLSADSRERAGVIHRALLAADELWRRGERDPAVLANELRTVLGSEPQLELEYAELRDPLAWSAEAPHERLDQAVALIAGRFGPVRLIDNRVLGETP